jgi:hypothetical protein
VHPKKNNNAEAATTIKKKRVMLERELVFKKREDEREGESGN